jgi:hypothetical protein
VLALKEVHGPHTGENLALVFLTVVDDYQIASKLRYFMGDNVGNNDTMMQTISKELEKQHIDYHPVIHRLCCNGHIINLSVQAFLFGAHPDAVAQSDGSHELDSGPTAAELARWRKFGPLGRIYNVVQHIQQTPQRRQKFRTFSDGLNLKRSNKTRWNSWYLMLDCALRTSVCIGIESFCSEDAKIEPNRLSAIDWNTIKQIRRFLKGFYDTTTKTEGRDATIDKILPGMDFLLSKYEEGMSEYKDNEYMMPCLQNGWDKLNKYYSMTDRSPVYIAAMVLVPK